MNGDVRPTRRRAAGAGMVTITYSRGEIDITRDAVQKLIRSMRHLRGAQTIIPKLQAARAGEPVELAEGEKGFLVVAINAWMADAGPNRVPNPVLRLRETLLGDLFYPVENDAHRAGVDDVDALADVVEPDVPEEPEPTEEPQQGRAEPAAVEARASLLRVHDVIGQELEVLAGLCGDAAPATEQPGAEKPGAEEPGEARPSLLRVHELIGDKLDALESLPDADLEAAFAALEEAAGAVEALLARGVRAESDPQIP